MPDQTYARYVALGILAGHTAWDVQLMAGIACMCNKPLRVTQEMIAAMLCIIRTI